MLLILENNVCSSCALKCNGGLHSHICTNNLRCYFLFQSPFAPHQHCETKALPLLGRFLAWQWGEALYSRLHRFRSRPDTIIRLTFYAIISTWKACPLTNSEFDLSLKLFFLLGGWRYVFFFSKVVIKEYAWTEYAPASSKAAAEITRLLDTFSSWKVKVNEACKLESIQWNE